MKKIFSSALSYLRFRSEMARNRHKNVNDQDNLKLVRKVSRRTWRQKKANEEAARNALAKQSNDGLQKTSKKVLKMSSKRASMRSKRAMIRLSYRRVFAKRKQLSAPRERRGFENGRNLLVSGREQGKF